MPKVILKGYILVPDIDLIAVREELPNHIRLTLQEKGCLVFQVLQDENNASCFNVYEEFSDSHSFEAHQERVKNSRWGEVTSNAERCYQIDGSD